MAQAHYRLTRQADLARQAGRGFAFAHPSQQQHCLRGAQVLACEHGATVYREGRVASFAAVDLNPTSAQTTKAARIVDARPTLLTARPSGVQVFREPCFANVFVQQI